MNQKIFTDIMREYEKIRLMNNSMKSKRKKKLFELNPRLLQIENELASIGIKISKAVLSHDENSLQNLQSQNQILLKEKNDILLKLNLSSNYLDVYTCYDCKDTGYVQNKKCKCFVQKLIERYYALSNLKNVFEKENFEMFNFNYYPNRYYSDDTSNVSKKLTSRELIDIAHKKSRNFVDNFDNEFKNLLFSGNTGLGKTFLCNCIAKEILEKGKTVLYTTAPQLFKVINAILFNKVFEDKDEYEEMIFNCDLLIIDDLGTEFITLATQSELFNIINTRMLSQKSIVISTNFSMEELENQYSSRIFSRWIANYQVLEFIGEDIRLQKKREEDLQKKRDKEMKNIFT